MARRGLDPELRTSIEEAIETYRRLGAEIVDIELPMAELGVPVYYVVACAEASSNLSRFDGVRYGHRAADYTDIVDMIKKSRNEGFGAEPKRRIMIGTYVLSHGYYDAYYLKAQKVRRLIAKEFHETFKKVDVIISPVTAGTPTTSAPMLTPSRPICPTSTPCLPLSQACPAFPCRAASIPTAARSASSYSAKRSAKPVCSGSRLPGSVKRTGIFAVRPVIESLRRNKPCSGKL